MNAVRKRKLLALVFVLSILATVVALVMYALGQNISLFYSPAQVVSGEAPEKRLIRLGGMVVKGSIVRASEDLAVQFKVTDFKETVLVHYKGILPDLFREGQGIVAKGILNNNQFMASEILAKHDANYMPPELKAMTADSRGATKP